ncbi:MAG TPA: hypothetical protein VI298_02070 [Geobacteraceae bacterium]
MNQRIVLRFLPLISSFLILSSCGGGTTGGGVAEFKTVTVSAQASTTVLESDVLKGNTCTATGSTGGTFTTDTVDVVITSSKYPNFTGTLSPVEIDSYTITFTPANVLSPPLPTLNGTSIGTTIAAGGSQTLHIPVAPDILKYSLVNDKNLQLCSATMYTYFVTITFNGLETNTGTRSTFETSLNVAFADRTTTS